MAGVSYNVHVSTGGAKEVTVVEVRNPILHEDSKIKPPFTDYEVCIKTTSKAFIIPQSFVRRRYSDFVWLKNWLEKQNDAFSRLKMPKLPPKKLVGKNDPGFVQKRMIGLQKFLKKIIEQNLFLSDKALHLFLQSGMSVKQIEHYLTVGSHNNTGENHQTDEALVKHFEEDTTRQRTLQSITEISPQENEENNDKSDDYSSSYSSISSSLLDSFEAINAEDCIPESNHDSIGKVGRQDVLENLSEESKKQNDDDTSSQSSLKGFDDEADVGFKFLKDCPNEKSHTSSNDSLAECDRK